jgi:hypothetical protein
MIKTKISNDSSNFLPSNLSHNNKCNNLLGPASLAVNYH